MTFLTIVFRDLWRRPIRTALTMLGIAIGIAAVIALVGMASGYEKGIVKQLDVIGIDVIVSNMEGGLMPKAFDEAIRDQVAALPDAADVTTVFMQMLSVEDAPMIMVSGREWGGFTWEKLTVVEGRMPHDASERAVVLGTMAAEMLQKNVGDPLQIETEEFTVVGIVDGHSLVENGAIILALPLFQEASGYEGRVNFIDIRVPTDASKERVEALCRKIEESFEGLRAVRASEVVGTSQGFKIAKAMSWSTSILAIIVGIFGVMNTMLMTVFERTHEIGILLALGWKKRMIMGLILAEAAVMGLLGGIIGVLLGAATLAILGTLPEVRGLLEPDLSQGLILKAILIAVCVGIASGLYPAWRGARLSPSVALQG
ncbi:MAG: ABC transporter permease [Terrimicrobiaceae bacterium]